jgi:hypothetical protein
VATAVAFLAAPLALASSPPSLRTIATLNQQPPGTAPGVRYLDFGLPLLNNAGEAVFTARLRGPQVSVGVNDVGAWSDIGGAGLQLVIRSGQAVGDQAGVYGSFNQPVISDDGRVFLRTQILSGSNPFTGTIVVKQEVDSLQRVVTSGDAVPGANPPTQFITVDNPLPGRPDELFFSAQVRRPGPRDRNEVWRHTPGGLEPIISEASRLPEMALDEIFDSSFLHDANASGAVVMETSLRNPQPVLESVYVLAQPGENLVQVAREGDVAPGASQATFKDVRRLVINAENSVAFIGSLAGPGVGASNDTGLWLKPPGEPLNLLLREGSAAIAVPGAKFADFHLAPGSRDISMARGNKVFFQSQLTGVDPSIGDSLWTIDGSGTLELIARAGNQVPDAPPGTLFTAFTSFAMNNAGRIAFQGSFSGAMGGSGIWAQDLHGALRLLVQLGDVIALDDGAGATPRTVVSLDFLGSDQSRNRQTAFNDRGELAFWAFFDDGTQGLFVSSAVAVPEPVTLALALPLVLLVCRSAMPPRRPLRASARRI